MGKVAKGGRRQRGLLQGRARVVGILRSGKQIYRGSLLRYSRRCGGPRCKCASGELHTGWALSLSVGGKTEVVYIPDELRHEVAAGLRRHDELESLLERIAKADIVVLRKRSRRYRRVK